MKKEKLDAVEAAVEERRQARDFHREREKALKEAKKQYDVAVTQEQAAAQRLERAERSLSKVIEAAE